MKVSHYSREQRSSIRHSRGSIISLLDMLKFTANDFQALMALLPNFRSSNLLIYEIGQDEPHGWQEYITDLKETLGRMEELCLTLGMNMSAAAIRRLTVADVSSMSHGEV